MSLVLTPLEFKQRWEQGDKEGFGLQPYTPEELADVLLPVDARDFLLIVGLPCEAYPCLSFDGNLERASVAWGLSPTFARYRVIGSTGSGDPVCIDEGAEGQIVYLNHDFHFARILMGTSFAAFSTCLLQFRDFPLESEDDPYTNTPESVAALFKTLQEIDPAACREYEFWWEECQQLLI